MSFYLRCYRCLVGLAKLQDKVPEPLHRVRHVHVGAPNDGFFRVAPRRGATSSLRAFLVSSTAATSAGAAQGATGRTASAV